MTAKEKKKITTLKARAGSEPITLKEALNTCVTLLVDATGLLYTPHWCGFAKFDDDGKLIEADGQVVSDTLNTVFEARVFNPQIELRWLHESDGKGRVALLSDDGEDTNLNSYFSEPEQPANWPKLDKIIDTLEQTYLLWGEGVSVPAQVLATGWSRLTTARIGRLQVPLNNVKNGRVVIVAREYLAEVDDHGNVAVIEERLIQLQAVPQAQLAQQKQEAA